MTPVDIAVLALAHAAGAAREPGGSIPIAADELTAIVDVLRGREPSGQGPHIGYGLRMAAQNNQSEGA